MQIPQQPSILGNLAKTAPGLQEPSSKALPRAAPGGVDNANIQSVLSKSYATLEKRLGLAMDKTQETKANAPVVQGDFAPAAVTERIMAFIAGRIEQERAGGASEERVASLYNQATKGLAQGFGDAAKIIDQNGLFQGKVKDDFFETISLVEKAMLELKESLFGSQPAAVVVPEEVRGAALTSVQAAQSQAFSMQIKTREGDVIDLQVSTSQMYAFQSASAFGDKGMMQAFSGGYERDTYFSFSVKGDLNEQELASINALFAEVNDVAELFFAGRVDEAFDRAIGVGLDTEQLASFSVNMVRTEVVAARQAYTRTQSDTDSSTPDQMFKTLAEFAARVKQADVVLEKRIQLFDTKPILADLLAKLRPESTVEPIDSSLVAEPQAAPETDASKPEQPSRLPEVAADIAKQRVATNDMWREFVSRLLA